MRSDVVTQARPLRKFALAVWEGAGIWLDPEVYIFVPREGALRVKSLVAINEGASEG